MAVSANRLVEASFLVGHTSESFLQSKFSTTAEGATTFEDKDFPADSELHPLDRRFSSKLLFQYPIEGCPVQSSVQSVGMFCFPNGMKLHETSPSTLWHSFVMTEETGAKLYGVCLTIYERISPECLERLRTISQGWKFDTSKLKLHEAVFFNHVKERMTVELAKQQEVQGRLAQTELEEEKMVLRRIINDYGEKILLYKQILGGYERHTDFPENIFLPKAIGVLSRWPFFDLFKDWLSALVFKSTTGLNFPLERYLINLTEEVPLPPRGKVEVEITLDNLKFYCARPPMNKIPILKNFSFFPLFRALSLESIVEAVESILAEHKIVVYSKHLAALSQCIESLLTLIFPFYWHYIYIPVLPASLMGYLQAPVPYIVGVHSSFKDVETPPSDVTIIDLDECSVKAGIAPPPFPPRDRAKLLARLKDFAVLRLPPGTEVVSMFNAFPGGQLLTTTNKSFLREVNSIDESHSSLLDEEADETPDRRASMRVTSVERHEEHAPPTEGDGQFQMVEGSKPRAQTVTAGEKRPPTLSPPRPNSDKILQHSFQAFQKSMGARKSAAKAFFSGESISTGSGSTASSSLPEKEEGKAKAPPERALVVRKSASYFADSNATNGAESPSSPRNHAAEPITFFNEEQVQYSFLRTFSTLLLNYRKYLRQPTEDEWNGTAKLEVFKNKDFISQLDSERRAFMSSLLETQAFSQFVLERIVREQNDYEVLFFDEILKLKKNRLRFTITKETTPFLDDVENYCIKKTHLAPTPNNDKLPSESVSVYKYPEFPATLDPGLLITPRKAEALENTKAELEMKNLTSALTRRARLDKMQKNEKRFWVAAPQFVKNKALRRESDTNEDRALMFDIILEEVWRTIELHAIPAEELEKKTVAEVKAACKVMYAQQHVLISAADDEQLVEKTNVEDLQRSLRTIIDFITQYEDHIRSRAS